MALRCPALGHHKALLVPKREEDHLHHGQRKTVHSPRSHLTPELVALRPIKTSHWLRQSQSQLICSRRKAQPPIDHTDSRCRSHSIQEVQSD